MWVTLITAPGHLPEQVGVIFAEEQQQQSAWELAA